MPSLKSDRRRKTRRTDRIQKANALRSEIAEGLERELAYTQSEMLLEYEKAKDLKNPRERGDAREHILRRFLVGSGLFPERYGASELRARVVSTAKGILPVPSSNRRSRASESPPIACAHADSPPPNADVNNLGTIRAFPGAAASGFFPAAR